MGRNADKGQPAEHGMLHPEVLEDLERLEEFAAIREDMMRGLYSQRLPRNILREVIVHHVIAEFGRGDGYPVSFYAAKCAGLGSSTLIRQEFDLLVSLDVVCLIGEQRDRRTLSVRPTKRAVEFYNAQMPKVRIEADRIFKRDRDG